MKKTAKPAGAGSGKASRQEGKPSGGQRRRGGETASAPTAMRRRAMSLLEGDPARLEALSAQEIKELVHELGTHQIELEMQNEELRRIQEELEESRRRYADLFEQAPVGYFTLDPRGEIVEVNRTAAAMLGREKEALRRTSFILLVAEEARDSLYLYLRGIIEDKSPRVAEIKLRKGDGTLAVVQLESIPVRDAQGEVAEIRTAATDISERKKIEEKLQRKSSLLRAIIDATDVMLVYLDPEFNFLWVNPAYANACNMKPEEMAGRNHFALYPHPENEAIFRRVRDTGEPVFYKDKPFEFSDQPERGVTYWDWSLVPVKDPKGKVTALVFSLRETTRYKRAELKLAESEERFRHMAETSSEIIFQLAPDGRIGYVSPAVRTIGYAPDQVQGRSFADFVPADEIALAGEALARVNGGEVISLLELQILQADGSIAVCEISATPIVREGVVVGVQGIARDITARKETENALRNSEAQLRAILHHLSEGVIVSDLEGNLIYWNRAAVEIHGFSSEAEYLRSLPEFTTIFELATDEEGVLPLERWPLNRILGGETLHAWEVQVRRLDIDRQRVYRYSGTLARDPEGNPLLAVLAVGDITKRKRAEQRARNSNALLQGINEIFEAGLACDSDEELTIAALQVAMRVTGSTFGFVGEIGPDDLLHEMAVSERGSANGQAGQRRAPGSFRVDGLYGRVLAEGVPFFTNDPGSHPERNTTPALHPVLNSFLGVPLSYGEATIGLIGLANREGGFGHEELVSVRALAPSFIEALFKCRIERALRESQARESSRALEFKQLLDLTPLPVWIAHDPQCRVITCNLAAARLVGVEPDRNVSLLAPDAPPVRVLRGGKELELKELPLHYAVTHGVRVDDVEIDILTSGGMLRRMLGTAAPIYSEEGVVRGGIAAYMDITERKSMEEQLLHAKQEWEMTFDAVPDLIAILDPQHRIMRANRAMADKMGMSPGQSVGNFCYTCIHNSTCPSEECPHAQTIRDGQQHMAEVHEELLGGDFLVTTTPLFDTQGGIMATVHVARDITQIKNATRLLQESEDRLKRAQQIAQLGSWELDVANNILTWSDEVFRIFGLVPQSFAPCYEDFLAAVHPEDREMVHDAYTNSLLEGKAGYELEHRLIQKSSGRIRYVHEKCEHIRDQAGKVVRSAGMVHDITDRKVIERKILILNKSLQHSIQQLAESNRELERSNQDLQQYAYIISHDLQEPLRTVSSFVQLLRRRYEGKLDAKADTFINFAVEGAAHMQKLLTDLLQFSRVGGGELFLDRVSLDTVLEKTLLHLRETIKASGARIEAESLPVVVGDEMQLGHLLQNLISNALKFRGEEPPLVQVSAKREKDEWVVCVRDNGIGIDPRYAERIFLIFQRLHRRDEYAGTGIGLAICRKVVERHGGRIWVESAPGKGAAFYFSLPAKTGEEAPVQEPEGQEG